MARHEAAAPDSGDARPTNSDNGGATPSREVVMIAIRLNRTKRRLVEPTTLVALAFGSLLYWFWPRATPLEAFDYIAEKATASGTPPRCVSCCSINLSVTPSPPGSGTIAPARVAVA